MINRYLTGWVSEFIFFGARYNSMNFQQQLRDWLSDCWQDFWDVSPRQVLIVLGAIVWAVLLALWRGGYLFHEMLSRGHFAFWLLLLAFGGALLFWLRRTFNR